MSLDDIVIDTLLLVAALTSPFRPDRPAGHRFV